jgi:hypothetical protein
VEQDPATWGQSSYFGKPIWFSSKRQGLAGGLASSLVRRGLARENTLMDRRRGLANLNWFSGDDSCGSASLMHPPFFFLSRCISFFD